MGREARNPRRRAARPRRGARGRRGKRVRSGVSTRRHVVLVRVDAEHDAERRMSMASKSCSARSRVSPVNPARRREFGVGAGREVAEAPEHGPGGGACRGARARASHQRTMGASGTRCGRAAIAWKNASAKGSRPSTLMKRVTALIGDILVAERPQRAHEAAVDSGSASVPGSGMRTGARSWKAFSGSPTLKKLASHFS